MWENDATAPSCGCYSELQWKMNSFQYENCFSDLSFQTFQVLQGSQELVEMSSASREWWSMIQSLSSDPSAAENRGSVTPILCLI